jgi:MFS family permease
VPWNRAFVHLWLAESISKAGDALSLVAVPLTAILALDAGPAQLGLLGAAQLLPIVFLGLPAGAWVDRARSRRRVMATADLLRGILLASVPVAWATGNLRLEHLLIVVAANAALGTFFDVAIASYVSLIAGRDRLLTANARLELSRSGALVLGPGIAGVVLRFVAAPLALAVDAVTFLASSFLVATSPGPEPRPSGAGEATPARRPSFFVEWLAGVRLALREPHLRAITATAMTNNLSRSIGMVVVVLYLVREAGVGPDGVAAGFALGNVGFIVGATAATRLSQRLGVGRAMRLGVGMFWPGMALLAVVPASYALAAFTVMVFMHGFGIALHNVNQVSVRQAVTPDHLRARVTAATRLLIMGAIPGGTLIGGVLATAIGLQATLLVSAAGLLVGSVPYSISRVRMLRGLPAEATV